MSNGFFWGEEGGSISFCIFLHFKKKIKGGQRKIIWGLGGGASKTFFEGFQNKIHGGAGKFFLHKKIRGCKKIFFGGVNFKFLFGRPKFFFFKSKKK